MLRLIVIIGLLIPTVTHAAALPPILCGAFPGCSQPLGNVIGLVAIPAAIKWLLNSIAALALVFVIIGGTRYLISLGREEEQTKGFKTILWSFVGLLVALTSHRIVSMITTQGYVWGGDPVLDFFQTVVGIITALLNISFLLVIIYGGLRMVHARGRDDEVTKGRSAIIYAIVGAIIINLAPIIVRAFLVL